MTWTTIAGDSGVVRTWRAAARESRVVAALRPIGRRAAFLRRDVEELGSVSDGEALVPMVESSALVRAGLGLAGIVERAARTSRAATGCAALASRAERLPPAARVRLAGVALLSGLVVHLALTRFSAPEPTVAARAAWAAIALLLVMVIGGAGVITAAWHDRASRRHTAADESE